MAAEIPVKNQRRDKKGDKARRRPAGKAAINVRASSVSR
jgi:hypothetical protein